MKRSKAIFIMAVFMTIASYAKAQHCADCSVNINGPLYVQVGETVTYTVSLNRPNPGPTPPTITWDYWNFLEGVGEIIDQGTDAWGNQYATVFFYAEGYAGFTFQADYSGAMEYDEIYIRIDP
jgi:hypothetical protein